MTYYVKHKKHGINKDNKYRIIREYKSFDDAERNLSIEEHEAWASLFGIMKNDPQLTEVVIQDENGKSYW